MPVRVPTFARPQQPWLPAGWLQTPARIACLYQQQKQSPLAGTRLQGGVQASRRYSGLTSKAPLEWYELYDAAKLAAWSGLCYYSDSATVRAALQADGLTLIDEGRNSQTSWFVAEGHVDYNAPLSQLQSQIAARHRVRPHKLHLQSPEPQVRLHGGQHSHPSAQAHPPRDTQHDASSSEREVEHPTHDSNGLHPSSHISHGKGSTHHHIHHHDQNHPGSSPGSAPQPQAGQTHTSQPHSPDAHLPLPPVRKQRFILLRGVHWDAPDMDAMRMYQTLGNWVPGPFAASLTDPPASLVAHPGVAALALDIFPRLLPHIKAAPGDAVVCFAGHSLGGSVAKLLWTLALLNKYRDASNASCFSFGSPPVLAHRDGGGGDRVLQLLGAAPSACRGFVLEHDPVPRALVTADPYFRALARLGPVQALLAARRALLGDGSVMSEGRFVYENVGQTLLMSWQAAGGYRIEEVVDGPLPAQQPAAQLPTNSSITTSNISSGSIAGSNGEQGLHSSSRSAPAAYSSPRSRLPGIAAVEHLFAMLPGAGPPGPAQGQAAQGRPAAAAGGPGAAAGQAAGSGQSDWGRLLTTSWQSLLDHHHQSYAHDLQAAAMMAALDAHHRLQADRQQPYSAQAVVSGSGQQAAAPGP